MPSSPRRRNRLLALLLVGILTDCAPHSAPPQEAAPWIVIGLDGGESRALKKLWAAGELPHLHALAERGIFTDLETDYGASPVIWTTIATGVSPQRHGIENFVVATEAGDVPISSAARKVPALWTMLTRAHRKIAVLGWWATWPAEEIGGLLVTDRVPFDLSQRIHPRERQAELLAAVDDARRQGLAFGGNPESEVQDRVVTKFAVEAVRGPYDLVLAYYRSVDIASHASWRAFDPEAFGDPTPTPADNPVSASYRAFDAALGEIFAAAPPEANIVVLSDHGFKPSRRQQVQLLLDLDRVL